ncbi:hypothetical protein GEMRC1_002611 [Eukaryota sp. GEM-RC1]
MDSVQLASSITRLLHIPVEFSSLNDFSSSFCVVVLERLFHTQLSSVHRPPKSQHDHLHNFKQVLSFLSSSLHINVSHLSPHKLLAHDEEHISSIIAVLSALSGVFRQSPSPDPSSTSPSSSSTSPMFQESKQHLDHLKLIEQSLKHHPPRDSTSLHRPPPPHSRVPVKRRVLNKSKVKPTRKQSGSVQKPVKPSTTGVINPRLSRTLWSSIKKIESELSHILASLDRVTSTSQSIQKAAERRVAHLKNVSEKAKALQPPTSKFDVHNVIDSTVNTNTNLSVPQNLFIKQLRKSRVIERRFKHEEDALKRELNQKAREAVQRAGASVETQLARTFEVIKEGLETNYEDLKHKTRQEQLEIYRIERERREKLKDMSRIMNEQLHQFEEKNKNAVRRLASVQMKSMLYDK